LSSLIDDGWNQADSNPSEALKLFKQALAISSSNAEANLGAGYVLKGQGNLGAATTHLCKAAKSPDPETQLEATGMLNDSNLSCP